MTQRRRRSASRFLRHWRLSRATRLRVYLVLGLSCLSLAFLGCLAGHDHRPWFAPRPAGPTGSTPPVVDRTIRVRLLGLRPEPRFDLQILCAYRLRDGRGGRELTRAGQPLPRVTVAPAAGSGAILLGAASCNTDDLLVEPDGDAALVVNDRTYRGRLRIRRADSGLTVTNLVDVESYLCGVLRGELPRGFDPQAQRALAVAARTYVLYEKLTAPVDHDYDVLSDERSQMYVGVAGEDRRAVEAVRETSGEPAGRRRRARKIFSTYYSSCCGGMTQSVREFRPGDPFVPTLAGGVRCNDCSAAPAFAWGPVTLSKIEITKRLVARYPRLASLGQITAVAVDQTGPDGRATRIRVTGSGGAATTLVGEDFRLSMGGHVLKSTRFRLVDSGKSVRFADGRGFGHGVGLCQYGADHRARMGATYRQILEFYFPGVIVRRVYR
ncbi:MAG: SpoIID/LytB domain-containing protein [Phycisphaerae bacterium]